MFSDCIVLSLTVLLCSILYCIVGVFLYMLVVFKYVHELSTPYSIFFTFLHFDVLFSVFFFNMEFRSNKNNYKKRLKLNMKSEV